jgi:hypothetical protein
MEEAPPLVCARCGRGIKLTEAAIFRPRIVHVRCPDTEFHEGDAPASSRDRGSAPPIAGRSASREPASHLPLSHTPAPTTASARSPEWRLILMDDLVLLARLRDSPTDLARIVTEVLRRQSGTLYVARQTMGAWEARDPTAWATVRSWLEARGVRLDVLPSSPVAPRRSDAPRLRVSSASL